MDKPSTRKLLVALLVAVCAAAPVAADPIPGPFIPQISPGELQNLQNRQQRLDYQQQQQFNRELDSQAIRQQQPRLNVPIMKPRCRLQTSGTPRIC
jgi:hypothetical protein